MEKPAEHGRGNSPEYFRRSLIAFERAITLPRMEYKYYILTRSAPLLLLLLHFRSRRDDNRGESVQHRTVCRWYEPPPRVSYRFYCLYVIRIAERYRRPPRRYPRKRNRITADPYAFSRSNSDIPIGETERGRPEIVNRVNTTTPGIRGGKMKTREEFLSRAPFDRDSAERYRDAGGDKSAVALLIWKLSFRRPNDYTVPPFV